MFRLSGDWFKKIPVFGLLRNGPYYSKKQKHRKIAQNMYEMQETVAIIPWRRRTGNEKDGKRIFFRSVIRVSGRIRVKVRCKNVLNFTSGIRSATTTWFI